MKIGVMCATHRELDLLLEKLQNKRSEEKLMRTFVTGEYAGVTVVAVIGGVGKVNGAITAQELIQEFQVEKLIFTGLAGGLDPTVKIGDVVIGAEVLHHDLDMKIMENGQFPGMPTDFLIEPGGPGADEALPGDGAEPSLWADRHRGTVHHRQRA